jgi:hypothetical protein
MDHPLAEAVLRAFEQKPRLDGSAIAPLLAGGSLTAREASHFSYVGEHALKALHRDGKLIRDDAGWFLLKKQNVERLPLARP